MYITYYVAECMMYLLNKIFTYLLTYIKYNIFLKTYAEQ